MEIAEVELAAVRELLDQLQTEVQSQEAAASSAERRDLAVRLAAPPAGLDGRTIALSRQIVEQMAATRRGEIQPAAELGRQAAEEQLREAVRRAQALTDAARRDAFGLVEERVGAARRAPDPEPELRHWTAPAPESDDGAFDQFWREEPPAVATSVAPFSPIEALLPTAALLLVLLAVLILIG